MITITAVLKSNSVEALKDALVCSMSLYSTKKVQGNTAKISWTFETNDYDEAMDLAHENINIVELEDAGISLRFPSDRI